MTIPALLDGILVREGGYRNKAGDRGGPTNWGITLKTLEAWRGRPCTAADVQQLSQDEARHIYQAEYVEKPGFLQVACMPLREQLVDFGVNSGQATAIRHLQRVLGLPDDGILGPQTLQAVNHADLLWIGGRRVSHLVNDALVASRSVLIDRLEDRQGIPASDEEGVESRALSFFLAAPPKVG